MIDWKRVVTNFGEELKKNSPGILTGFGICGMFTMTVLAVLATPKAMEEIKKAEEEKNDVLTPVEKVKATWKIYLPSALTGTVSTACLISAGVQNGRRNAVLATAYGMAESTLREYRAKTLEAVGPKKEMAIQDEVHKEQLKKNPPSDEIVQMIADGSGSILCQDYWTGNYFYTDVGKLDQAVAKVNNSMTSRFEPYVSYNDFLDYLNVPPVGMGNDIGWNIETLRKESSDGVLELYRTSTVYRDTIPVIVFSFNVPPYEGYRRH